MKRKTLINKILIFFIICLFPTVTFSQTTYYVSTLGNNAAGGTSPSSAFETVEEALLHANANDTLKIAAGTYIPENNPGFIINQAIAIWGSWDENFTVSDFDNTPTIFSGDVNENDVIDATTERIVSGSEENRQRILAWSTTGNGYLNGVIIQGGIGGTDTASGIYLASGSFFMENVKVRANLGGRGAGMYVKTGVKLTLTSGEIKGNSATGFNGAGLYTEDGAEVHLTQVNFQYNKALDGPAVFMENEGLPAGNTHTVNQCTFANNENLLQGGTAVTIHTSSPVIFIYSTFANNEFTGGYSANSGAIYTASGNLRVYHCIFMGNTASVASAIGISTYSPGALAQLGGDVIVGNGTQDFFPGAGSFVSIGYNILNTDVAFAETTDILKTPFEMIPYLEGASLNGDEIEVTLQKFGNATPVIMPAGDSDELFSVVPEAYTKAWLLLVYDTLPSVLTDQRLEEMTPNSGGLYFAGPVHIDDTAPLPIELLTFSAYCNGNKIVILWETATEINNDYFTVERSQDAYTFVPVRRVQGAGNSNTPVSYIVSDDNFALSSISYYRLRQTDFNGSYTYFPPVAAQCNAPDYQTFDYSVYPNPVTEKLYFAFSSDFPFTGKIEIYNSVGMLVQTSGIATEIEVSHLSRGFYFIRILNGIQVLPVKKFEKIM